MRLLLILALSATLGCSTAAHVKSSDGTIVTGTIVASDREALTIAVDGESRQIARAEVDDIDHPGNVVMVNGAIGTSLFGLLTLGGGLGDRGRGSRDPELDVAEAIEDLDDAQRATTLVVDVCGQAAASLEIRRQSAKCFFDIGRVL